MAQLRRNLVQTTGFSGRHPAKSDFQISQSGHICDIQTERILSKDSQIMPPMSPLLLPRHSLATLHVTKESNPPGKKLLRSLANLSIIIPKHGEGSSLQALQVGRATMLLDHLQNLIGISRGFQKAQVISKGFHSRNSQLGFESSRLQRDVQSRKSSSISMTCHN